MKRRGKFVTRGQKFPNPRFAANIEVTDARGFE
jgi:hypothetical protein